MNKCLLLFFVVILMLVSCSPMLQQEGPVEIGGANTDALESTSTIETTKTETPIPPTSTPTASVTPESTSTETPALSTLEILMQVVLNAPAGSEEYMAADKAFVEYMNASTPKEVTINLKLEGNNYEHVWTNDWLKPGEGRWRWVDQVESLGRSESMDRELNSLLPTFFEGGIENGNAYAIDPETGEKIFASKINVPGLGELSIVELLQMDPEVLKAHFVGLMEQAGVKDESIAVFQKNTFPLPVMMWKNFHQNDPNFVYHYLSGGGTDGGIPTKDGYFVRSSETNTLLMPLYDDSTGDILGWTVIHQGIPMSVSTLTFNSGGGFNYDNLRTHRESGYFGDGGETAGIIFPGSTIEKEYVGRAGTPFLEPSKNVGSQAVISEMTNLMRAGKTQEALELAQLHKLYVLQPRFQAFQK